MFLRRPWSGHLRGDEHIFDKNAVASRRVVYHNVGDSSNKLSVLNDRGARHECGQVRTTFFYKKLKRQNHIKRIKRRNVAKIYYINHLMLKIS